MKPKLFLTREIPMSAIKKLEEFFSIDMNFQNRVLTKEELKKGIKKCEVLLCLLTDEIDKELLNCNTELKGIANYAVGFNNIDIEEATRLKIPVTNTPGVLTETTADLTWSLLMSVARKIVPADRFMRNGKFKGWEPMLMLGNDVHHKTIGIVGVGRIGRAVAKRAKAFEMEILCYDVKSNPIIEKLGGNFVRLDVLLKKSDFITFHVPLVSETYHLIGHREFALMKSTAIIINTSRGPVIDESAMVEALLSRKIAGAGLDVYEFEPACHETLYGLDSTVILPHIGSASIETRTSMGILAAKNAIQMMKGETPDNIVNPEIYK